MEGGTDSLLCWRHTSCAKHMFLLLVLKNFPVTLENLILLLSQWFCVVVSVCRIILFLRCLFYYKNNPVAANSLLKDIFFCKFLRVVCKILIKFWDSGKIISKYFRENFEKYLWRSRGFPGGSDGKESACNSGDLGSIPELKRPPGESNGFPLQYSCLENSMDRGALWSSSMGSQRVGPGWVTNTQDSGAKLWIILKEKNLKWLL